MNRFVHDYCALTRNENDTLKQMSDIFRAIQNPEPRRRWVTESFAIACR